MAYTGRNITNKFRSLPLPYDKAIQSSTFPDENIPDGVTHFRNCLGLYGLKDLPRVRNITIFSHIFGKSYSHCVVLSQVKEKSTPTWILYDAVNENDGKEALKEISRTLYPLLRDGSVVLTDDLLDAIITPSPTPPDKMTDVILEMMESSPDAHPEWSSVVQALLYSACKRRCSKQDVSNLVHKGGDLYITSKSGDSPYNVASSCADGTTWLEDILQGFGENVEPTGEGAISQMLNLGGGGSLLFGMSKPTHCDAHTTASEDKSETIRKALVRKMTKESISLLHSEEVDSDMSADEDDVFFKNVDKVHTSSKETPLYISIGKGYVKSSLFFLLGGANPNYVHPETGNTCLHLAAEQGSLLMMKMLVLFGADPSTVNNIGKAPEDVLKENPDVEEAQAMLLEVKKLREEYKCLPSEPVKKSTNANDGVFLLALDGGGSRCVSELQALIAVEKRMKELHPDCKPFISHFDYVAGTSGGALIAFMLVYNKTSIVNARALNCSAATYTAGASVSKKTKNIEKLIKNTLGENRVMADVQTPRCIVAATLANQIPPKLHLITNYGEARDGQLGPNERKIWEAARISSAAPTYFLSFDHFVDGGFMANNPTMDALVEMQEEAKKDGHSLKLSCVLSLGSAAVQPNDVENIDVAGHSFGLIGLVDKVDGYKNLLSLMISQLIEADDQNVRRARTMCDLAGATYFRLNSPVGESIPPDTSDPVDLIQPMFDSFIYTLRNAKLVDEVARTLLSNPRLY